MVRLIGILVGLGFVGVALWSFLWGLISYVSEPPEKPAYYAFHEHPRSANLPSQGPFGKFDRQQLQRGFQVYRETCAACHGINFVAFRNLADLGYNEAEIRAIAANWPVQVPDIDPDTGEATGREAIPSDRIPSPYPNEIAARAANNNAVPPDLSLIVKARHDGVNYTYSLLTGYQQPPANLPPEIQPGPGLYYNPYFHSVNLAMPPPLTADGQVTYADGTPATVDQMARDVSAFLHWTAEPFLENRHRAGFASLFFLLIGTALAYMAYRNIWADKKGKRKGKAVA
ncbi:MAG: cytochrome c1 [Allosphingosinicella sp.]|uniref:cytochrome c1 n=1 Tax=Allosphingosinicella sp. TaxID=2823234 RepID=UPI0039523C72